jgi:hypothetical protein
LEDANELLRRKYSQQKRIIIFLDKKVDQFALVEQSLILAKEKARKS